MKKRIITILSAAVIGTSFMAYMPILPQNTAIAAEEIDIELPNDMNEYLTFIAKYGNVSAHGKYIVYCDDVNYSTGASVVMEQTGTAEIREIKSYSISDAIAPPGPELDGGSTKVVYIYEAVTPGTVEVTIAQGRTWQWEESKEIKDVSSYEIADDLTITAVGEEDELAWLPQTESEFKAFVLENGEISTRDCYIVYCGNVGRDAAMEAAFEQNGTAKLVKVKEYVVKYDKMMPPGTSTMEVHVFKAITSGTVSLKVSHVNIYQPDYSNTISEDSYTVDDDLTITKIAPPLIGDVNGNGSVETADLVALSKWLLGTGELEVPQNADVFSDGVLDVYDLVELRRIVTFNDPVVTNYEVISVDCVRSTSNVNDVREGLYVADSYEQMLSCILSAEFDAGYGAAPPDLYEFFPKESYGDYFENNVMILVYNDSGAGNKTLKIDGISKNGNTLTVHTTTTIPQYATPDMAYYRAIIAVRRDYFDGVTDVNRTDTRIDERMH